MTTSFFGRSRGLVALLGALAVPGLAAAQTNERIYEDFRFHFVTPGARQAGMGKTFIGLADDATAAATNPAGLVNLLRQEFSIEVITARNRHTRFVPSETGETQTFASTVFTPSFLSYVIPFERGGISFFRHAVQDYREDFGFQGRFIEQLGDFEDGAFGTLNIQAENYGFSTAVVVSEQWSVGGSFSIARLNMSSDARSGAPVIDSEGRIIRSNARNGSTTIGSDLGWSALTGVLFKPRPGLSIGATYNSGTTFELTTRLVGSFLRTRILGDPTTRESVDRTGEEFQVDYVAPPRYSAGASWRVHNRVTLLADWSYVRYSNRVNENFLIVDFSDPDAGLINSEAERRCRQPCNFYVNDVHELHGGGEWRFFRPSFTTALRAGIFTDPDHKLRFRSGGNNPSHPADRVLDFRFNTPQEMAIGVTAGWGIALANRFQIDVAVSRSRDLTELVVSTVIRPR